MATYFKANYSMEKFTAKAHSICLMAINFRDSLLRECFKGRVFVCLAMEISTQVILKIVNLMARVFCSDQI